MCILRDISDALQKMIAYRTTPRRLRWTGLSFPWRTFIFRTSSTSGWRLLLSPIPCTLLLVVSFTYKNSQIFSSQKLIRTSWPEHYTNFHKCLYFTKDCITDINMIKDSLIRLIFIHDSNFIELYLGLIIFFHSEVKCYREL